MTARLIWTEGRDAQLRRLRADGATWDQIAAALRVSRYSAIERGRRIGAPRPPRERRPEPADLEERRPLPAGHSLSWGVLVTGTVLEGFPYPFPVFE